MESSNYSNRVLKRRNWVEIVEILYETSFMFPSAACKPQHNRCFKSMFSCPFLSHWNLPSVETQVKRLIWTGLVKYALKT